MLANDARYWYRSMPPDQFKYLKKNDKLKFDAYGGIATNRTYSRKPEFFGNDKPATHLLEFDTFKGVQGKGVDLYDEFRTQNGWEPKAEGDGGTYGLGSTGHGAGAAGDMFNAWLESGLITWRLIDLKVAVE